MNKCSYKRYRFPPEIIQQAIWLYLRFCLRDVEEEASSLAEEKQKARDSDESMVGWLGQQVGVSGAKAMAELLGYDEANLAKVIKGKRRLSGKLRKRISEHMTVEGNGAV
jgi:hypothetical protein